MNERQTITHSPALKRGSGEKKLNCDRIITVAETEAYRSGEMRSKEMYNIFCRFYNRQN